MKISDVVSTGFLQAHRARPSKMVLPGVLALLFLGFYFYEYLEWTASSSFIRVTTGAAVFCVLLLATIAVALGRAERELRESHLVAEQAHREWRAAFDSVQDLIFLHDKDMRLCRANRAYLQRAGLSAEQAIGRLYWEVFPNRSDPLPGCQEALAEISPDEEELRLESGEVFLCRNYPVHDQRGDYLYSLHIMQDITERKRFERQLEHQATHDTLTGLPNRLLFSDRLGQAIAHARRSERATAVLLLDLDRLKLVNDSLGHGVGDEVLKQVAARLRSGLRESDTVGKLGGDEFVVVLGDIGHDEDVVRIAHKLLRDVSVPIAAGGRELVVSASIGISMYPRDGSAPETLLADADIAMRRAKERGRANFQFFAQEMNVHTHAWLDLEADLRRALRNEEMTLYFQPQLDLRSGRVIGAEALVRWRHPSHGMIPPARFIPLAEDTGLIVPLGEWVLDAACEQARTWQDAGLPPLTLAVNVSAHQLRQSNFAKVVAQTLWANSIDPLRLELELTESAVMHFPELAVELLGEIAQTGVRLALDDFGTGYSSLNYLKRFPVDRLKIDQSFVRDITRDRDDAAIVGAIVAMAHSLELEVVAEGVETAEQLQFLRRQQCDAAQGYHLGRPMPADDFAALLRGWSPLEAAG